MINKKSIIALEFDKIRAIVAKFAVSDSGKCRMNNIMPAESFKESFRMLEETEQADKILYEYVESPDFSFDDISVILDQADKNLTLTMGELLKVARLMKISRNVEECINKINSNQIDLIKDYVAMLYSDALLENDIYKNILSENEIADNASQELKRIRDSIVKCNISIKNKLNSYTSSSTYSKYMQDSIITIRNNRYVIPVKSEFKSFIDGLVHDQSASGATVFIEPFAIIQLNNEIAQLKISENFEIERILKQFTIRVASETKNLRQNYNVLTDLDCIFARALYAHKYKASKPILNVDNEINIINGRHPLIDAKQVVPVSLSLDKAHKTMLITGPNTGGKTVTLKIIGLFTIMAMCGIYPLCDYGSKLMYFEQIYCDIGDEQSIEQSLSTFSSHLINLINITRCVNENTLVLVDELGAGTDPIEGACLAVAISEKFINSNATSIMTTHYQEMKEFALTHENVIGASMDFDPITFAPTYKLIVGATGSSNAIEIAKRLGLDNDIVNRAKSLLSKEKVEFDAIILSADKTRREAEKDKENIQIMKEEIARTLAETNADRDAIAREKEKLNEKMAREAKKVLADYLEEADELLDEIKSAVKASNEQALFKARTLKNRLENIDYETESKQNILKYDTTPIKVGDAIYIKDIDKTGIIIADDKRKCEYTVKIGLISTAVKYTKVAKIQSIKQKEPSSKPTVNFARRNTNNVSAELKVIGMRVDEALDEIDKYLDSVMLAGLKEVRIVHGKGEGILRKAIHEHFNGHPRVNSYRLGKYGEGESGVTIVEIK